MNSIIRWLAPEEGVYNDWRLISTTSVPELWLIVLAVLLLGALFLSAMGSTRLGVRRRILLFVLRVVAALLVIGLVLMPAIELRAVSKVRSRIALLVDGSRSMELATPSGTRSERVSQHLADNKDLLDRLAQDAVIEPAVFGERLHPLEALPPTLPTGEPKTDIARALADIPFQASGRDLGAILLYSDGADTEGLTVERAKEIGRAMKVPIYAVGFATESATADLAIRRVVGDDFAFLHNSVTLDVDLEARGLDLKGTTVTLKRDGAIVASKEAELDAAGRATVSFEFKPNRIGRTAYEVSVPVVPGEAVTTNNTRSFALKVIRDRIRILQVAGRPSWDERFLRELLKRNPNVDLISFFILRSTTDLQKASQDELALIPFPVNELFTKELSSFDIVIIQNFTYKPYRMANYLAYIADYVERGGSLLMIGGNESFEDGSYAGTPIADVLPVRLGGALPWDTAEYRPRLTPEGRRHPITLVGEPGEPPEAVYQRLPPLQGANVSLGLVPGAQALLVHPSLPGNPPIVSIREVNDGRSMALATDSLWFWRFVAVGEGSAGREFDRFWSASLRWLIKDPELSRVRLSMDHTVHSLGQPVSAEARVLGPDYRGLPEATVKVDLFRADHRDAAPERTLELKTGADGNAPIDLGTLAPGSYVVRAAATSGIERIGTAEEPVIIEATDVELMAPFPRPEILRALAESSGGKFFDVGESLSGVEIKDSRRVEVDRTRVVPIWDGPWSVVLLALVLTAEWWLRRRSGLL
ncbi:MAG: glutamine amidotransferase [Myxococcota bacterium]